LIEIMFHLDPSVAPSCEALAKDMEGLSMRALKERVVGTMERELRDVRGRYESLMFGDQKVLEEVAEEGGRKARESAEVTMKEVREAVGFA